MRRRPKTGLWANFYEIPWLLGAENESAADCLNRLRGSLNITAPCAECGLEETFKFTRWHVRVHLYSAALSALATPAEAHLAGKDKLLSLPMPAGLKRLVRAALDSKRETQPDLFAP